MASSTSNTFVGCIRDSRTTDSLVTAFNKTLHKVAVNGCWRPAHVKDQQPLRFLQQSLSCLLKVGIPSHLGRESRPAAPNRKRTRLRKHQSASTQNQPFCPLSVPRGEKQRFNLSP